MRPHKEFKASGGRFIDPEECGSTVGWWVDVTVRPPDPTQKNAYNRRGRVSLNADMALSDCHRRISWSLDDVGKYGMPGIEKLDNAIAEMQACREALARAFGLYAARLKEFGDEEDEDFEAVAAPAPAVKPTPAEADAEAKRAAERSPGADAEGVGGAEVPPPAALPLERLD